MKIWPSSLWFLPDPSVAEFFKEARTLSRQIPVLLTADEDHLGECTKFINYHPLAAKISYSLPLPIINSSIKRLLKVINRKERRAEPFCAIEGKLFLNLGQAPYDLYLKIGDGKMVKVFNRGTKITKEDIVKYELKNHPFFFLQAPDYEKAMSHILTQLEKNIKDTPPSGSDKLGSIAQFASSNARQLLKTLGLSDTSLAMANASVNTISKMAMENTKIANNFKKFIKGKNYLSDHSLAIPFVAAAVMEHIGEFGSKEFEKLSYAAFFHDVFLDNEELAIVKDLDKRAESYFGNRKIGELRQHPAKAVELLSKIDGLPMDVDKIILQHHERPDGLGYPRGLDHKTIHPLAAVFIVIEDFVDSLFMAGLEQGHVDSLMDDMADRYSKGNFKIAFQALQRALGHGQLGIEWSEPKPLKMVA